jgi:hypothetical protein
VGSSNAEGDCRPHKGNEMANSQLSEVIQHLRRAMLLRDSADFADGQLLEDYPIRLETRPDTAVLRARGPAAAYAE